MTRILPVCGCGRVGISRRQAMGGFLAAGAGLMMGNDAVAKPQAAGIVDVHHHCSPPFYLERWAEAARPEDMDNPTPNARGWTPQLALEHMDAGNVRATVLSILGRPFFERLGIEERRTFIRRCNEHAARLTQDYPGRFKFFGHVHAPDVDGSLAEIEHSFDTLGAVGILLMSNYGDRWLGDAAFVPVLEELNRRKATVFIHPFAPACCRSLMPQTAPLEGGLLEIPYDTGRTVISLLFSGRLARFPDIKWILCHAGGAIPVLAGRIRELGPTIPNFETFAPKGIDYELQRLYYDTANSAFPPTMAALLNYVPASQVVFGSDYPIISPERNASLLRALKIPARDLRKIEYENAQRIMNLAS